MPTSDTNDAGNLRVSVIPTTPRAGGLRQIEHVPRRPPPADGDLTEIANDRFDQAQVAYGAFFADDPQLEAELKAVDKPAPILADHAASYVQSTPISGDLQDGLTPC